VHGVKLAGSMTARRYFVATQRRLGENSALRPLPDAGRRADSPRLVPSPAFGECQ
jgi:hypothetical protein